VGNLSFDVTRDELIEIFNEAGRVVDAKVPTDRETGRPRGFAFVEFEDEEGVNRCIQQLNGKDVKGRPLRINEAENRPPRAPGAGGLSGPPRGGGFTRAPGGGGSRGPGAGFSRPSPGYGEPPPEDFPPAFEKEDQRGKRFRQKPAGRKNSRRRRDQVVDDEDY
jgi:RNA recognition motif-containing protein